MRQQTHRYWDRGVLRKSFSDSLHLCERNIQSFQRFDNE